MSHIEVVDWSPAWAEQFQAVAAVLRKDLRDAYAAVKLALAADPGMDIETYVAGKSEVLQQVLEVSGEFSDDELAAIHRLNQPVPDAFTKR